MSMVFVELLAKSWEDFVKELNLREERQSSSFQQEPTLEKDRCIENNLISISMVNNKLFCYMIF